MIAVESASAPRDVAALLASTPGALSASPRSDAATTIAVRREDGALLATAATSSSTASPRSAHIGSLAWHGDDARYGRVALYLALRRARIDGATAVAATTASRFSVIDDPVGFAPLAAAASSSASSPSPSVVAHRLDLALHRSYLAAASSLASDFAPSLFSSEVVETLERWLRDLFQRGFFQAAVDGALGRGQFVYAISNMHQFVRWTTRLLGAAVACSDDRRLRDHFLAHLSGEIHHELILEADLAHLGEDVRFVRDAMAASPATRQFMAVQESLIGFHRDPVRFLASPLAAEGVASHLTPAFLAALERTVASWGIAEPKKAMSFFLSHVHTDGGDDGHWEMVVRLVESQLGNEERLAQFLGCLRASMASLTAAYDEYVDDLALFAQPARPASRAPAAPPPTVRLAGTTRNS